MSIASHDPYDPITPDQWQQIRAAWPNTERLATAFQLARDHATCVDLLAGRPVAEQRLDQAALTRAREHTLVTLTRPIDQLQPAA